MRLFVIWVICLIGSWLTGFGFGHQPWQPVCIFTGGIIAAGGITLFLDHDKHPAPHQKKGETR